MGKSKHDSDLCRLLRQKHMQAIQKMTVCLLVRLTFCNSLILILKSEYKLKWQNVSLCGDRFCIFLHGIYKLIKEYCYFLGDVTSGVTKRIPFLGAREGGDNESFWFLFTNVYFTNY